MSGHRTEADYVAQICALADKNAELISAIENALVGIKICSMQMGANVASNETILQIAAEGLRAAIDKGAA